MKKIIIAIDGHSACGKSSTAKMVARELGYRYIDSGAMYRASTWYFLKHKVNVKDQEAISEALNQINIHFEIDGQGESQILLNGTFAESFIRTMEVNQKVSEVSAISLVRKAMVEQQRFVGRDKEVVMDGRDIGTVVFPNAELKIFMTASLTVRAQRRQKELADKGVNEELSVIAANLQSRDKADSTRKDSPLRKAEDAVEIDTTNLTFDEQVHKIVNLAQRITHEG